MVILIMGVSGSGKTTVGRALARALGGRFYDGDDYHSPASVAKMRSGTPLTDDDRADWLRDLRSRIDGWLVENDTVVLACSALTARIRKVLGAERDGVRVIHLRGAKELIRARMRGRAHFMPAALLDSQFALLEPPDDALTLDISQPPDTLVASIIAALHLA